MYRLAFLFPAILLALPAQAADDDKRFSLGLSIGLKPDMANLGETITKDGTVDVDDSSMAAIAYGVGKALMSDRDNLAIYNNSSNTDGGVIFLGSEPTYGGPLLGIEIGLTAQYDLDDAINFPLYVRTGFQYTFRMSGGTQERAFGPVNESLAGLLALNGLDPADYEDGVMKTQYDASWFEIPITIGVKIPTKRPLTYGYGGIGLSYLSGSFSVGLDADEAYNNVLATHLDIPNFGARNLSPGAVEDTVEFKSSSFGLNWHVGAQAGIKKSSAIFIELGASGSAETVLSEEMKEETQQLLTAVSSDGLYDRDDDWFEKLAFPVVLGGASVRLGFRYYFF